MSSDKLLSSINVTTVDISLFTSTIHKWCNIPVPEDPHTADPEDLYKLLALFSNLESAMCGWYAQCRVAKVDAKRNSLDHTELIARIDTLYESIRTMRHKQEAASRLYTMLKDAFNPSGAQQRV